MWSQKLSELKRTSRAALAAWRTAGCCMIGPERDRLVFTRREYKKAVKAAKHDVKKHKAIKLQEYAKCSGS